MNASQMQGLSQHWELEKEYDGAGLHLHKRKSIGVQWFWLYRYIHSRALS
ncbi:DUF4102 domain-containing protein [Bartonella gliris]